MHFPNKTWHVSAIFPEEMSTIFEEVGMKREELSQLREEIETMRESGLSRKDERVLDEKEKLATFADMLAESDSPEMLEKAFNSLIEKKLEGIMPQMQRIVSERENVSAIENVSANLEGFDEYLPQVTAFIKARPDLYQSIAQNVGAEGALKAIYLMASGARGKEDASKMREQIEKEVSEKYEQKMKDEKNAFVERGNGGTAAKKEPPTLLDMEREIRKTLR
jgi:hypothetical protein